MPAGWKRTVESRYELEGKVIKLQHKILFWDTDVAKVTKASGTELEIVPWYGNKCEYKHKMAIPHSENWTIMLQEDYAPKEMTKAGPWQTRLFPTSQDYKGFKHMQQLKPEAIIKPKSALQTRVKQIYWFQVDNKHAKRPRLEKLKDSYDTMSHEIDIEKVMKFMQNPSLTRQQKSTRLKISRDLYEIGDRKTRITKKSHLCKHCLKNKFLARDSTAHTFAECPLND